MKKIISLVLLMSAAAHASDANSILTKVRDRYDGEDYVSKLTLKTTLQDGLVNTRQMYMMQKDIDDEEFSVMSVQAPVDLRDVSFLMKTYKEKAQQEDEQWMYLPAFRKVRRISPVDKRGAFMGSEFSYFDLDKLRVGDFNSKVLGEETVNGRPAWKIERIPTNQDVINKTGYYKVIVWVDKERDLVIKQRYFDAKNIAFKEQESVSVEKLQDIWTITKSKMTNHVENKVTEVIYHQTIYNVGLPSSAFKKSKLRRGINHTDVAMLKPITLN